MSLHCMPTGNLSELVATAVPVVSLISAERWVSVNIREDQYASLGEQKQLEGFIPALNKNAIFKVKSIRACPHLALHQINMQAM